MKGVNKSILISYILILVAIGFRTENFLENLGLIFSPYLYYSVFIPLGLFIDFSKIFKTKLFNQYVFMLFSVLILSTVSGIFFFPDFNVDNALSIYVSMGLLSIYFYFCFLVPIDTLSKCFIKVLRILSFLGLYQALTFYTPLSDFLFVNSRTKFSGSLNIRVTSVFDEPSYFVPFLLLGILVAIYYKFNFDTYLFLSVLLLTFSTTAYLTISLAIFCYILYKFILPITEKNKISYYQIRTFSFLLIAIAISVVLIQSLLPDLLNVRLAKEFYAIFPTSNSANITSSSGTVRIDSCLNVFSTISDFPLTLFFGAGPGSYEIISLIYGTYGSSANNTFCEIQITAGTLGLFGYISIFFIPLFNCYKQSNYNFMIFCFIFVMFIDWSTKGAFLQPAFYLFFYLIFQISSKICKQEKRTTAC